MVWNRLPAETTPEKKINSPGSAHCRGGGGKNGLPWLPFSATLGAGQTSAGQGPPATGRCGPVSRAWAKKKFSEDTKNCSLAGTSASPWLTGFLALSGP